jgi:hypothetical protein
MDYKIKYEMTQTEYKPEPVSDLSESAGSTLGYALCKCWKDNPSDLAVHEYYDTLEDVKEAKRNEKKDPRYTWVIAEYK